MSLHGLQTGIRQHIESAKVYYEQQRQPDPFRDYWTTLVHRVHDAPDRFCRLSHPEQIYYLLCVLQGEVFNGGDGQFFDNSSGDYYRETLDALGELGAMRCQALLVREAVRKLLVGFLVEEQLSGLFWGLWILVCRRKTSRRRWLAGPENQVWQYIDRHVLHQVWRQGCRQNPQAGMPALRA